MTFEEAQQAADQEAVEYPVPVWWIGVYEFPEDTYHPVVLAFDSRWNKPKNWVLRSAKWGTYPPGKGWVTVL